MNYEIFYSPAAVSDLESVWDGVFEASSDYDTADNYVNGIREKIRSIQRIPRSGIPLCFENVFTGVYFVVYKKYHAFYRIRENRIEVSRILLGKSNYLTEIITQSDNAQL